MVWMWFMREREQLNMNPDLGPELLEVWNCY